MRCAASCTATSASRWSCSRRSRCCGTSWRCRRWHDMASGSAFPVRDPGNRRYRPAGERPPRRALLRQGLLRSAAERREPRHQRRRDPRLEQLYPFPENTLGRVLAPYRNADVVWCQEEPENMGAWSFVDRRIEKVLKRLDIKAAASALCRPRGSGQPGDRPRQAPMRAAGGAGRARTRLGVTGPIAKRRSDAMATEIKVPDAGRERHHRHRRALDEAGRARPLPPTSRWSSWRPTR